MATRNFTIVFEAGAGDGYWKIEEDADGLLYVTSNAESRTPIDFDRHRGWDADELRAELHGAGVPEAIVGRYFDQAGLS
jgi:hypothetical protein